MQARSKITLLLILVFVVGLSPLVSARHIHAEDREATYDVLIYGATPAGIAAAVSAGRHDHRVLLIEPTSRIGGLMTNGLSHPDFRTFEAITGLYADLVAKTLQYYTETYGPDSQQVKDCLRGTHPEPKLTLRLFAEMLKAQPNVTVMTATRLDSLKLNQGETTIDRASFIDAKGKQFSVDSALFIDATYEGDLMAAAGVDYRVGRESRDEYDESLAPVVADEKVQGYNFRLTMTNQAENRTWPVQPANYDRTDYLDLLPLIASGEIEKPFHITTHGSNKKAIYKAHDPLLPNGKFDINDMSRGNVRLSLPQFNNAWPDGDQETRRQLFDLHVQHNIGMFYFFQNDEAVPEEFRRQAREWGFCRDEFLDSQHLPVQLYVREARRMVGMSVFTQQNTSAHSLTSVRSTFAPDAVAMGDYGPNCHGTGHEGPLYGGQHTGEFYQIVAPYQIPYGTIVPRTINNLLVPGAVSSSHVGFCALRLEPIWISLGEAAGTAAHLALTKNQPVQDVSAIEIRRLLHRSGCATIYVSDLSRSSPDFELVQWWGSLGGWHNVVERTGEYGQRGPHFRGQYFEAFPDHAADLSKKLDPALVKQWRNLAAEYDLEMDPVKMKSARTRGEFLRAIIMPE